MRVSSQPLRVRAVALAIAMVIPGCIFTIEDVLTPRRGRLLDASTGDTPSPLDAQEASVPPPCSTDLASDPINCGQCGQACTAACKDGACVPVVGMTDSGTVKDSAVDGPADAANAADADAGSVVGITALFNGSPVSFGVGINMRVVPTTGPPAANLYNGVVSAGTATFTLRLIAPTPVPAMGTYGHAECLIFYIDGANKETSQTAVANTDCHISVAKFPSAIGDYWRGTFDAVLQPTAGTLGAISVTQGTFNLPQTQ